MIDPLTAAGVGDGAAISEAIVANEEWLSALEQQTRSEDQPNPSGEKSLPRIGINGPGFLALTEKSRPVFARAASFHIGDDGRLLDAAGREVLGFPTGAESSRPQVLRISVADINARRFRGYDIDESGVLQARPRGDGRASASEDDQTVPIGRLCLAVFAAPQQLAPRGEDVVHANALSGAPQYVAAGAAHLGSIRHNPQSPKLDSLQQHMRAFWSLTGQSEIDAALSASNESMARVAINLVK